MKTALIFPMITLLVAVQGVTAANEKDLPVENPVEHVYIPERTSDLEKKIRQALGAKPSGYVPRTEHQLEDGSPRFTNRLILEDSPYLIQHAHNPVDWHTWGEQAFAIAKSENKPIFLSIGYSTCHWCHVMEKESFENAAIADFINRNFIAIKVDRERRPDLDEIYMNAVRLMTGDGGWPMSSFLTPEGKPFVGGTYFPPEKFLVLLQRIARQWAEQQPALLAQAELVANAVDKMGRTHKTVERLSDLAVRKAVSNLIADHDKENGGFGFRPKFPNEPKLFLMLNDAMRNPDPSSMKVLRVTLDAMAQGSIYDQVGGGFHRYSVLSDWSKPHFEKMLYNQAHLARVYLRGWYLTGNPIYRRIAVQTLDYVLRDMTSEDGAFYSGTDADSEGEEGMFFFWRPSDIRAVLSAGDAELALELYDISEVGYHQDLNILYMPLSLSEFAKKHSMTLPRLFERLDTILETLYLAREQREHPHRDEKIITAWNGMMISTLAEAGMTLNEPRYTNAATRAAEFIWRHNHPRTGQLWRIYFNGRSSIEAQQEDYAFYAEGLLRLYDATTQSIWLQRARELTDAMLEYFWDDKDGGFFMSAEGQQVTGMGRPRDGGNDHRIPSGNSMALRVLHMLDARTDSLEYEKKASATLAAFAGAINKHPEHYGYMLATASDAQLGEVGPLGYAARGGIRILARQTASDKVNIGLSIPEGWHINSNRPLQDNLIPTRLSLNNISSGWSVDHIEYPTSHKQALGFQSGVLSLFKGDAQIQMKLKRSGEAARILPLSLKIQACNDRVCLPPESVSLQLAMQ